MSGDEVVRSERDEISRFVALGLGPYEAILAVESGLDSTAALALFAERGLTVAEALSARSAPPAARGAGPGH